MKNFSFTLIISFLFINFSFAQEWNLVWSDEFETEGAINSEKWFHQTQLPNGWGWYNNEKQHYTNRIENSYVEDGILKIVAKKEDFHDQGHTKEFTSARLNSKFAFQYGKVEVRAILPVGQGTWPAIWTLGKNITEPGGYWTDRGFGNTSWPACGEIDIMEHWGNNQNYVQSATHTPSSYGGTINHGGQMISTASSQMHTYGLVWTPEKLIFSVDDVVHYTYNPPAKNSETWPFDAEQYLLLNFAISEDIDPNFAQDAMEIDYVRVYQPANGDYTTNVTFQVDMSNEQVHPEGVYLAGGDMGQEGYLMSHQGNDIWSVTIPLDPNKTHLYKFRNQPSFGGWDGFEDAADLITGGCNTGTYNDRYVDVAEADIVLDVVAYGSCTAGTPGVLGCTDNSASNYNAAATQDDGSCLSAVPASEVPTEAAEDVISIFSNAYTNLEGTNFNPGWGQATQVTVTDDVLTYTGLNYQGTQYANQDVSAYGYLNVDFYTTNSTNLKISLISPGAETPVVLDITQNQWNSVEIPLTSYAGVVDLTNV
ncbi:MAG: glycoside hydrolase family 16 protein, partial [Flavobacteriales bacterium]|nr:glycoside hydrolase family 16 protein [Flavobacteriales bacterium]